jgi:transposase
MWLFGSARAAGPTLCACRGRTWAAVPADACSDTANPAAFPVSHGVPRVDDRRVLSGIIYVIRHELQWRDARPPTLDGRKPTIFRPR